MTLFTDNPFEKMMIQKPDYGGKIPRRSFLSPRLARAALTRTVPLCGVLYQKSNVRKLQ